MMLKVLRPNSIIRLGYRIVKISIPVVSYLYACISRPKLINFFVPWIISNLDANRSAIKDEVPWITFEAMEWLENFISQNKNMSVFEYGSGGSTLYFKRRAETLISVEHNPEWFQIVSRNMPKNESPSEYILLEAEPITNGNSNFADPRSFSSSEYPNMNFYSYVNSINAFQDKSFDLVFIDGRARSSCMLNARSKVKPGGYIMLDNSERSYYSLGKELLIDWDKIDFFGPAPYGKNFWQTSIWRRPPFLEQAPLLPTE